MRKNNFFRGALFLIAVIWGGGFPITKIALDAGMAPNAIMAIRFMIASLLIFIFLLFKKVKINKGEIELGVLAGVILGIAFSFQTVGLKYTTPAKNAFLTGANVVMVPFLIWLMTKKKPSFITYLSSIICFTGIGFLSLDGELGVRYGDLLTLISACFFALQLSIVGVNIDDKNPIIVNAFQMLSAGILTLLLNMFFEDFSILTASINRVQAMSVGFLIIFNTLIAFSVQTIAQKYVPSSTAALILSTEIIFGAITSILFMGEEITARTIIGGIMIFGSVLLAENGHELEKYLKIRFKE